MSIRVPAGRGTCISENMAANAGIVFATRKSTKPTEATETTAG